jgi:hypothetical protein
MTRRPELLKNLKTEKENPVPQDLTYAIANPFNLTL